jgi:hypothetical protein
VSSEASVSSEMSNRTAGTVSEIRLLMTVSYVVPVTPDFSLTRAELTLTVIGELTIAAAYVGELRANPR